MTAIAIRYLGVRALVALSVALLLGYWAILVLGAPAGVALTKTGNIGNVVDLAVLGKSHLYAWDEGFEPEGLVGTLPATVNVIWGYLAGRFIVKHTPSRYVLIRYVAAGVLLIAGALLWDTVFPIGKKLWTSSFVLLTVGIDLVVLAGLIAYVDLGQQRFGVRFFEIFGKNPLFIYMFSELLIVILWLVPVGGTDAWSFVSKSVFQAMAPGALGALLTAIAYTLLCWLMAWGLDAKKIVIKV